MEFDIKKEIQSDILIKKFCLYGFLKNLQFFKPYLIIYLTANGLNLFNIGILISIREIVVNIVEIPSGVLADFFGRKKVLLVSFVFYSIAFVFFFFTHNFSLAAVAMLFFGLGSAFRSGTHKAMIYSYLEQKNWQKYKTFVYGRTRSYSLTGSAVSSLIAIAIMIYIPHSRFIFLASILPFLLDFLLVVSYPNALDRADCLTDISFIEQLGKSKNTVIKNRSLWKVLFSESIFEALIKSMQDFIQPILASLIVGSGIIFFSQLNSKNNLTILLGLSYALINLMSAFASRHAYVLKNYCGTIRALNSVYILNALLFIILSFVMYQPFAVIGLFIFMQLLLNIRKPIFVDEIDCHIQKSERATILSMTSQMRALMLILLAPCAGYFAENYGISTMFQVFGIVIVLSIPFVYLSKKNSTN